MAVRVFVLAFVIGAYASLAEAQIRTERVQFPKGESGTTINDTIVGRESVSYVLGASAGQTMTVSLQPSNLATYFNVYAPGKGPGDEAIANSGVTGPPTVPEMNRFVAVLPDSGDYTISVYMMRSAARRNERSDYTLDVSIAAGNAGSVQGDALVPGTDFHATGEIPCARYEGQPMTSCRFGVIRRGNGGATVRVFWPDGGERSIDFENGTAASSDSTAGITSEKRSDLNMVFIGANERFEIVDAIIYGG